jgi:mycothiol synthase
MRPAGNCVASRGGRSDNPAVQATVNLSWRPLDSAQAGQWARLAAAIEAVDRDDMNLGVQDLLEDLGDPDCDFPRGSVAVYDGDVMAGYGLLRCRSAADPVHEMYQDGGVHPAYRGLGLGGQLLDWAERAAVPLHEERFAGHPLALNSVCNTTNSSSLALRAGHGYEQARWFQLMRVQLPAGSLPGGPVPEGVEIAVFTPERSADAHLVDNEAFRDHWGSTDTSAESWAHETGLKSFRPAMSFLAYLGGEPVSAVLCSEFEAETQATGRRDLWIGSVGTRRVARNRGIASALLAHVLRAAAADGYQTSTLSVDADSPTGAVGLYERAGYSVVRTSVTLRKELRGLS